MNTLMIVGLSAVALLVVLLIAAAASLPTMGPISIDVESLPKEHTP